MIGTNDFRSQAVAASEQRLESLGEAARNSPVEVGISYCIPAPVNASGLERTMKVVSICALGAGFFLILMGMYIRIPGSWFSFVRATGIPGWIFPLVGVACCLFSMKSQELFTQRFVRKHISDFWSDRSLEPVFVLIENARTFSKPKLMSEDYGIMIVFPKLRVVQIEGIHCRYLIHGVDVTSVSLHTNKRTTILNYGACGVELSLAIGPRKTNRISADLATFGRLQFEKIKNAVGIIDLESD